MDWRKILSDESNGRRSLFEIVDSIMNKNDPETIRRNQEVLDWKIINTLIQDENWRSDGGSGKWKRLSHTFHGSNEKEARAVEQWFISLKSEMEELGKSIPELADDSERSIMTNIRPDDKRVKITFGSRDELVIARGYLSAKNADKLDIDLPKPTRAELQESFKDVVETAPILAQQGLNR